MSELTEAPTPHRLAEARRRGQVALSRDLSGAVALAAAVAALIAFGPASIGQLVSYFALALGRAPAGASPAEAGRLALDTAARVLALPLAAAFLASVGAGWLQTGGSWVSGPLAPDLRRLSPAAALRRTFSAQTAREFLAGVVKVAIVAVVAGLSLRPLLPPLVALAGAPARRVLSGLGAAGERLALRVVVATLLIGLGDYAMVRARHRRSLRMTRREVQRERRETEGDEAQRAERRRLHGELGASRAMDDVRRADLVVTGPEGPAIALAYRPDGPTAPVVVASGERLRAAQIEQLARAAGVPVFLFHDTALARALGAVAEGDEIPETLYEAVAELFKRVYRLAGGAPVVAGGAPVAVGRPAALE